MAPRYFSVGVLLSWLVLCAMSMQPARSGLSGKWEPYTPERVSQSLALHKPVVIDFSAEWCPGCHILEKEVFTDPRISSKLAQVTTLRVDATYMGSSKVQDLLDQYQVIGLPTVVFLDAKGNEIRRARVEGAGPVEEFLQSFQLLAKEANITFEEGQK